MKFSKNWLYEWVNSNLSSNQLAEQLSVAGLEVNEITPVSKRFSSVVVGKILQVNPHPHANKLQLCEVGIHPTGQTISIVCGANNVKPGLVVATALPGAILPDDIKIQTRTLRGIVSAGMLCSAKELGLDSPCSSVKTQQGVRQISKAETSQKTNFRNGSILELPSDFPIGTDLWEHLQLEDQCLALQITPNRGDCLSILGLAREVAALTAAPLNTPVFPPIIPSCTDTFLLSVQEPTACPRYIGRIIRNLNPLAQTPYWMAERLRRSGQSIIHPIVDVTNYVLLELGNPLHAFDLRKLQGSLTVRFAQADEKLQLLNKNAVLLQSNTLIIADAQGPQAIAGIMGGLASAVTPQTTDIFLESAHFTPAILAGRARQYSLMTEASYRFERGVDPNLCRQTIERATQLLLAICGGQAGPLTAIESRAHLPNLKPITLRKARLEALTGLSLPDTTIAAHLMRLGIITLPATQLRTQPAVETKTWQVQPPSWRFDLTEEVDIIEEVLRVEGYHHIPIQQPKSPPNFDSGIGQPAALTRLRHHWMDQGYHEVINYNFTALSLQTTLNPNPQPIALANPLSAEYAVLRTSLWPGLILNAIHNQHRQQARLRLFEIGPIFLAKGETVSEQLQIGGLVYGSALPEQWGNSAQVNDFFDTKNVVENNLQILDKQTKYTFETREHPALYPVQNSCILKNDQLIGWIGALHPRILEQYKLQGPIFVFEWKIENAKRTLLPFQALSRFPSVRRDLAFWAEKTFTFHRILTVIRKAAETTPLVDIKLFDVYQQKNNNQRSLAVGLIWHHHKRTLTDKEIEQWQAQITQALQRDCHIQLRDNP
jgi:phenylalanyl-tRNA synthetase beta chain